MKQRKNGQGKIFQEMRHNELTIHCTWDDKGKLQYKTVHSGWNVTEFAYTFDTSGHLARVEQDGELTEEYQYNIKGQRTAHRREGRSGMPQAAERLHYDKRGRLASAGSTTFDYDDSGALSGCYTQRGVTAFSYGQNTMLNMAVLPYGAKIRYEYIGFQPVRRYRYLTLTGEYTWDGLKLTMYRDHDLSLEYAFAYTHSGMLDKIRLRPLATKHRQVFSKDTNWPAESADWLCSLSAQSQQQRLWAYLETWHQLFPDIAPRAALTLCVSCDQVGTPLLVTDSFGRVVKKLRHDSFGVLLEDNFPDFFLPIGFAGGLVDADTGLLRFGWRDYDPKVGRFTAPDPANDKRGDGDLYDYCVDDPVSRVDPTGLWAQSTFNESRISRDEKGQFSSGGRGSGGDTTAQGSSEQTGSSGNTSNPDATFWKSLAIQSEQLAHEFRKRLGGKDGAIYKKTLDMLQAQTPDNGSTEERELALEILITCIDTVPAAAWIQSNLWEKMPERVADEIAAVVYDNKIRDTAIKQGAQFFAKQLLKRLGASLFPLSDFISPQEANPLNFNEKKRMREKR